MATVDREQNCPYFSGTRGEEGECGKVSRRGGNGLYNITCTLSDQEDYKVYHHPPTDGSPGGAGERYLSKDPVDKENIRNSGCPRVTCRAGQLRLLKKP